ncbi:MAG TPA: HAD family hydrolase [Ktedonobacterales bacterium]|nr:HAD family hydrolase [Ktedonobacterales bacterium]
MATPDHVGPAVFILDCDNTLLDNDALKDDLDVRLRALLGEQMAERFWQVYEDVRRQTGTVDYLETIEYFRYELHDNALLERVRMLIMDYPFAERLYPGALDTLAYLRRIAFPTIVSDGDDIYQPLKIERAGLAAAVEGHVLIYVHKEEHLDEIFARWPALFYVMVDDKAHILAATKARFPDRFVTVHVRQGHYGLDPEQFDPAPDVSIEHIAELRNYGLADLRAHLAS